MKKLTVYLSILLGCSTFNTFATPQTTIDKPSMFPGFEKRAITLCKTDKNGYVLDAQACVKARAKLYILQAKAKPTFKGFINSGFAKVNVNVNHPEWGERRNITFKDAILKAQTNFIIEKNINHFKTTQINKISVQDEPEFTSKEKDHYREHKESKSFLNKLQLNLSKKDDSYQNNPDVYQAPLEKKQVTDSNINGDSKELNVANTLSGIYVVKTYEATTAAGDTWVSAIIRGSISTKRQIASLYQGGSAYRAIEEKKKVGQNIDQWFAKNYINLYKEFGARLIWDEQGYPIMLAFGQASNWHADGSDKHQKYEENIIPDMARNDALATMAKIFNLQIDHNSKEFTGTVDKDITTIKYDGKSVKTLKSEINKMIVLINKSTRSTSEINGMQGLKIIGQYENYHPINGQKITGYVLAWSPKFAKDAAAYNHEANADTSTDMGNYDTNNGNSSFQNRQKDKIESSLSESTNLMNDADF